MSEARLLINMVIDWLGEEKLRIERLLWIDRAYNACALIQLNKDDALPYLQKITDLEAALSSGEARIIEDPLKRPKLREHEILENHKAIRNEAYEAIAPLIEGPEAWRLFEPRTRGQLVGRREQELKKSTDKKKRRTKKTIYLYMRRYWQWGQTKNALLPLYENSGAKGIPRYKKAKNYKKLGRKSNLTKADPEQQDRGININEKARRYILLGAKMFYERRKPRLSLKDAHDETLKRFFNQGYGLPGAPWAAIPPDADKCPSLDQFIYHYRLNRKLRRAIKARVGEHVFNTQHRETLGDSTLSAQGPGSVFQVDATIADVYLCSLLDPSWYIGRPILYVVIDVFSRLIVGISVGLVGPSWEGAMLALLNTVSNKVEFCRQYGIHITEDEWPSCHLPDTILADRGEFEGYNADNLTNALDVEVTNTPAWRPDLKGIVENQFNMIKNRVTKWAPGEVRRRAPGEKRCELDAALNIHEFRQLMASYAIEHNLERRLNDYPMSREMIAAKVEPYPINIWNWGVENFRGAPKKKDEELIRINLLPEATASISKKGIEFKGARYSCAYLLENEAFLRAGESKSSKDKKVKVAFDPRLREPIYLRLEDGKRLEPCYLTDRDKRFSDCDFYETDDYFANKNNERDASKTRESRERAKHSAFRQKIMEDAVTRRNKAVHGLSDSERLKNKREHRQAEIEHLRETEGRRQAERSDSGGPAEVIPFDRSGRQQSHDDGHIGPAKYAEEFNELDERSADDE